MACSNCARDIRIAAKGLCGACYQRMQKRGTLEYAPRRVRGVCQVSDCSRPHAARGYCDLHHQRLMETGNPEATKRPDDWGAKGLGKKERHPLYNRWAYLKRHATSQPIAPEWLDFLTFVMDIGEAPEGGNLYAADDTKPIGPHNFVWKRAVTERVTGEVEATYQRRRQKTYRYVDKERYASYGVKQHYGLSRDERTAMVEEQEGKCAICDVSGKTLCVDHCHDTGKVRGLLCHSCNRALGLFGDERGRVIAAVDYLERHASG